MKPRQPAIIGALLLALVASGGLACKPKKMSGGHDHGGGAAAAGSSGHNHGAADRPKFSHLRFTETNEVFIEYPTFQAGENSTFAIHLTKLEGYQPIKEGQAEVIVTGAGGEQKASAPASETPGLFNVDIKPSVPGKVHVLVVWNSSAKKIKMDLGEHEVYKDLESAVHGDTEGATEGISFPKIQQWQNDFAIAKACTRNLLNGYEAYATIQAVPGMEGRLLAPVSGRLEGHAFPSIGQFVKNGQRIGSIVPKGGSELSMGTLQVELKKAELRNRLATKDIKRMKALQEFGAVPLKQVEEAENELAISEAELKVAKANLTSAQTGRGGLPLALIAPASGIVSSINAGPGIHVVENQELMYVVDTKQLRMEVQVPEAHAASLSGISSVCFQTPGLNPIILEASKASGIRILGGGGVVHPERRTVPFVLEFPNKSGGLKVGQTGKAMVRWGKPNQTIAVPAACLQDEDGMNVVYAQIGGETFERRIVRVGARDGEWVQILAGLEADERLVAKGAHMVRLAASKSKLPSHGCIH